MSLIRNLIVDMDESLNPSEVIDAFAYEVFSKIHDETTGMSVRVKCLYPLRILMHKKAGIDTGLIPTRTLVTCSYGKIVKRIIKIR